jgi:hypothetical protein
MTSTSSHFIRDYLMPIKKMKPNPEMEHYKEWFEKNKTGLTYKKNHRPEKPLLF